MTDISNWPLLVELKTTTDGCEYVMLPFDLYQIGNLLGLLKRSTDKANGDWFYEVASVLIEGCVVARCDRLNNNFSDEFGPTDMIIDQIRAGISDSGS